MADDTDMNPLDLPKVYLIRMMVFVILVAIVSAVLYPQIERAFSANPGLNGLIVFTLLMGIVYAFRQVWRLFPEVNWVNSFRIAEPGLDTAYEPRLLAPMAAMLGDRGNGFINPVSSRSLLDSIASRLDEARDISRYLIGLLVFLGLLGTFWGLLETVSSVGLAIKQLDVTSAQSATIFEELKAGLEAPLAGMGISFSSSLFGLAGSLVLGFLDLQSSQAQNRFYNDLEDWLSSITDIGLGDSGVAVPHYTQIDLGGLRTGIDRINTTLETALSDPGNGDGGGAAGSASIERLADAVQGLVHQMREEQKIVRQWAQSQSDQQAEIRRLLGGRPAAPEPGAAASSTATAGTTTGGGLGRLRQAIRQQQQRGDDKG